MGDPLIVQFFAIRQYICRELRRLDREQQRLILRTSRLSEAAEARNVPVEDVPTRLRRQEDGGARFLRYEYFYLRRAEYQLREARHQLAEYILSCGEDCEALDGETLRALNLFDGLIGQFAWRWDEIRYTSRFLDRTYLYNSRARRSLWFFPVE